MKILDIIIPHETLDENAFTDMMAKGRQKVKDVANDVGELTGIRALRTRESNKIADYVDDALTSAGKDLKRSEGLAAAERSLLDIEKNISLEGLSKKRFDEMAEYLATKLKAQDRTLHDLESPIVALQNFIKTEPNPQAWMNSKQIKDNLFNNEFQDWLTKSTNARIKIKQEVELAGSAPPPPKSKAEKEADKLSKEKTQLEKDRLKLARSRLKRQIEAEAKAQKAADGRFKITYSDGVFMGTELAKIGFQWDGSRNEVNRWQASGQLPADVAELFPEVTATSELPVKGGDSNDERYYYDNEERVTVAADWARAKLIKQVFFQLLGGTVAFAGAHTLKGLGGGFFGWASHLSRFNKLIAYIGRKSDKAKVVTDWISTALKGMSQASKYLFVDYFLSAANNEAWNVKDAALQINKVLPDSVYNDLNISHTADINKAIASLVVADTYQSVESFVDSAIAKQLKGAFEASYVPPGLIIEPCEKILGWIKLKINPPTVDLETPPIPGPIPGVGTPVNPKSKAKPVAPPANAASAPNASADQSSMSGDNSPTTSSNSSQAKVPPAKTNKKLIPSDSGHLEESINKSLKRRVAQLMKS
jgi:hypothetical protein